MNSHLIQNALKKNWITEKDLNDFDIEKKCRVPSTLLDKARKERRKRNHLRMLEGFDGIY